MESAHDAEVFGHLLASTLPESVEQLFGGC